MTIGQLEDIINNKPEDLTWEEWRNLTVEVVIPPSLEVSCYTPCEFSSGYMEDEEEGSLLLLMPTAEVMDIDDDETQSQQEFDPELN
jgi:hypothetical protein